MPLVFLTTPGTRASLVSERLPVELPASNGDTEPPAPRDIPLFDVEQIVADERVQLTTPALCECLRRSIPVIFLARNQSVLGLCQPPAPAATVRHTQHQRVADAGFTLAVAATLVEGKIQNCRRVLQRSVTTSSSPPNTSSDATAAASSTSTAADAFSLPTSAVSNVNSPASSTERARACAANCAARSRISSAPSSPTTPSNRFWSELKGKIDEAEDRLVAYKICLNCARDIRCAGTMVTSEKVVAYVC
jgi:hypothetical protein